MNVLTTSLAHRIYSFLDAAKSKRHTLTLLIFAGFFLVSWATVGTLFGSRGSLSGDDWYHLTNIVLGELPACTAGNSINPWRPFHPTSYCILYQIIGPNLTLLYTASAFVFTFTAFAWFGILRNVFKVSRWLAFAIGLLFIAYPDDLSRLSMVDGMRMVGPMATLYGIWAVLTFWDKPREIWRLVIACLLTVYGLLTYETLVAAWAIGLPLALLYKHGGLPRRWFRITLVVELVTIGYFLWRYLILPTTYTAQTVIAGAYDTHLALGTVLERVWDSFLYVIGLWAKALHWLDVYRALNSGANAVAIVGTSLIIGLLTLFGLILVYCLDRRQMGETPVRGRDLFLASLLLVFLMALPFYAISIDWMADTYHSVGSPFAASVALVGLLWLVFRFLRKSRLVVPAITVTVTAIVVFSTVFSGYSNAEWQRESSYACDFFVRFTDVVERLPPDVYVIVTAPRGQVLPDYFDDVYRLTSNHAMLFFEGPYIPASYDYGRMGHTGYLIVPDSFAELTADGVKVSWPPTVTDLLHVRAPLPRLTPLDHTILVKYAPYRELTILSAPENLDGMVIHPEGGATSRASTLARRLCDWDRTTSATIQRMDQAQAKQSHPTAAAVCRDEGVTIYQINGDKRSIAFQVPKGELDKVPPNPPTNTLVAQGDNIRLYRLTSGELQINAPASSPEAGEYVFIWNGCSR